MSYLSSDGPDRAWPADELPAAAAPLEGVAVHGSGQAAAYVQLDSVRAQLIDLTGIDPYPGTLNLALEDDVNLARWRQWRTLPGETLESPDSGSCRARCYPVQLAGSIPAAVLLPELAGYPEDRVELVAALPLRQHLELGEAARLKVDLCRPLAVRAALFDLDGTLVDSVGAYIKVAQVAAAHVGLEATGEQVRKALATGGSFWKGIIPGERSDGAAIARELSACAAREWPQILRENATLFDGVARTLDTLKEQGIILGIYSGARPEVLELLRAGDILDRFDAVILGPDVSRMKPDPEGIIKCLQQLGVAPGEALYVGDAPVDIQASRAAGVYAVSVLTGAGDSAMLSAYGPDRLIASHSRLPALVTPLPANTAQR